MDLDMYEANTNEKQTIEESIVYFVVPGRTLDRAISSKAVSSPRGPYRSYTQAQVQELLDLVIEKGMSARKSWLTLGNVVRTAQHYVKLYKKTSCAKKTTTWV
jgi:hypothetical protein